MIIHHQHADSVLRALKLTSGIVRRLILSLTDQ
jgi:hypothetical protein